MDFTLYVMVLVVTGIGAGLATGLLGVGGGFIISPVLFFLMDSMGVPHEIAIRTAFGTSLAVILPTAMNSAYSHHCKKCVRFRDGIYMGITGFFGSIIGAYIASLSPAYLLRAMFGGLLIIIATQFTFHRKLLVSKGSRKAAIPIGGFAGLLSGLLGIGGGVMLVPLLVLIAGFEVLEAVGTSSLVIAITAAGGVISYIYNGLGEPVPGFSIGYINILQFIIIVLFSIPSSRLGAIIAHKVDVKYIRYIFIALLLLTGVRMIL